MVDIGIDMGSSKERLCHYCKQQKKLCKAHITPECFYVKNSKEPFLQIQADDFKKRLPVGYYDENIICSDCDNTFSDSENYASKIFNVEYLQSYKNGNMYVLNKAAFRYNKIRKFVLSMLWKASVSAKPACSCINLGQYEDFVLNILKGAQPDNPDLFKIFIVKFKEKEMDGVVVIKKSRVGRNITYSFICRGFMFYVIPRLGFNVKNEPYNDLFITPERMIIVEVDKNFNGTYNMLQEMMLKQIIFVNSKKGNKNAK